MRHRLSILFVLGVLAACSDDPAPSTNGVNDVKKACELRVPWTRATTAECADCRSIATAPFCDCVKKDYSGKCNEQSKARQEEPSCSGVEACVRACAREDCACIDACYAGKDACRVKASAEDGCVTEVCAAYCK